MQEENPYKYIVPFSKLGKRSIVLIVLLILFLIAFYLIVDSGQRSGQAGFFGNLWLAVPLTFAAIFGNVSFIVGLVAALKQQECSVFVLISIFLGLVVLLWTSAYILPLE